MDRIAAWLHHLDETWSSLSETEKDLIVVALALMVILAMMRLFFAG